MYTKQEIILRSYREGKSQRGISRELQINRKTVKKYVEEYEIFQRVLTEEDTCAEFSTYLTSPPIYKIPHRDKRVLTEEVILAIEQHVSNNLAKIASGQRKQILKKVDIFASLQEQGFDVGYTTVCNYIRGKSQKHSPKEAFIRQIYQPGSVCEFDWAEIKLEINGKLGRYYLAVFTSAYSNYRYSLIFQRQDTLAFMESHVSFFSHIGGVFHKMTYDNMRVAVAKFVGPHEKEPTRALLQMRGHYQFTHRFCNAHRGNEKGHVERSVEYIRRKSFGFKQSFRAIEEAQAHLHQAVDRINKTKQQLTGKSGIEMLEDELPFLYKIPSPLACSESIPLQVDKYSTICYGTNYYSVPDNMVELVVDVKVCSGKLDIFHRNTLVATHERNFGHHKWEISIEHYLTTLKRKPGALASSVALANSPYLHDLYNRFFNDTPRDFVELLQFCARLNVEQKRLEDTVELLIRLCSHQITAEKITAILGNKTIKPQSLVDDNNEITIQSKKLLEDITAILN